MDKVQPHITEIVDTTKKRNRFVLRWQVTSLCNYYCDFCIQGSREVHLAAARSESRELRQSILEGMIRFIERRLQSFDAIDVFLIGGEVSVLDDLPAIIERIVACDFPGQMNIQITTNLSKPASYYSALHAIVRNAPKGNRTLYLSASFYRAYTTEADFERKVRAILSASGMGGTIVQKAWRKLRGNITGQTVQRPINLLIGFPILDDQSYEKYLRLKTRLKHLAHVDPIYIYNYPVELSDEVSTKLLADKENRLSVTFSDGSTQAFSNIQQVGFAVSPSGRFCPSGYYCDAGMRMISIDTDGLVKRCQSLGAGESFLMGDICNPDFDLLAAPAICTADHCGCNSFARICTEELLER